MTRSREAQHTITDHLANVVLSDTALRMLAKRSHDLGDPGDWTDRERLLAIAGIAAPALVEMIEGGADMRAAQIVAQNVARLAVLAHTTEG